MPWHACIVRVNRQFDGVSSSMEPKHYRCEIEGRVVAFESLTTEITWRLGGGVECDESLPLVPQSGISARGTTILREDGFAHFVGPMEITDFPTGQPPVHLFSGQLELIGRTGSHQHLGESCDEPDHFEGWLEAIGCGPLERHRLRCVIVGTGMIHQGITTDASITRITGTLFVSG